MKKLLSPIVLLILLAVSCKKKEANISNATTTVFKTYGSMDEIFDMLSLKPKVVTFDAAAGNSFYGNSGTRYIFQPNCFQDATGATVTGNVQVEVTEWLNKGDMIFSGVLPVSNGEPLVSGGEIYVKATKGAQELFLKPGMTFEAKVPQFGSKDTMMQFFKGDAAGGTIDDKVTWDRIDSATGKAPLVTYALDTMNIISNSFEYCNADRFVRDLGGWDPQNYTVTVSLASVNLATSKSVRGVTLFDNRKSVWPLGFTNGIAHEDHVPSIPCHLVAYTLIDGHFYGGVQAATPKTGENYTVTLTEVDPAAFKAQLALYP